MLFEEVESFSIDELEAYFYSQYPALKADQLEAYSNIFQTLRSQDVSDDMLLGLINKIKARNKALEIGMVALDVSEGKAEPEKLSKLLSSFEEAQKPLEDVSDDLYVSTFRKIMESRNEHPGLKWRLSTLNKMMGPLRKGNFIKFFARPETGKTTLLASEVTYMGEQLTVDNPAVWFNNEEERDKVWSRIMQGALGIKRIDFERDPDKYDAEFQELLGGKLYLVDDGLLSKAKVERICAKVNPGLIVFDQIGKITGFDADREDLHQGKIYQWGRALAKKYGPVIAVGQADGTGEGIKWLTMSHIANAKTAIQAECDAILGIGKSHKDGEEFVRYLHMSKNKLDPEDEAMRHGKAAVIILPQEGRYRDV